MGKEELEPLTSMLVPLSKHPIPTRLRQLCTLYSIKKYVTYGAAKTQAQLGSKSVDSYVTSASNPEKTLLNLSLIGLGQSTSLV